MSQFPSSVRIVEVGPRDGLQNESRQISTSVKTALIENLALAGVRHIEVGSFVSPKWVPQMADSPEVFTKINRQPDTCYSALVPNLRGFEAAVASGVSEVAVFAAASESFSQRNINCSIAESLRRFEPVFTAAKKQGVPVRGYISCVLGCPYEGQVSPQQVTDVAESLVAMGCYEVSLGDTIGIGTPGNTALLIESVTKSVAVERLAVHFHDTYGQAIANIYTALQQGVAVVDSSVAGLGGCPFAEGASGNVATEDVVYLLDGLGVEHGINLSKLARIGSDICTDLGRANGSKAGVIFAKPGSPIDSR